MHTSRKPNTFPATLWRAARVKLLAFGLFAAFAVPFTLSPLGTADVAPLPVERPIAQGSPEALLTAHDCWTGEAPADMRDVVPGHVVVTKAGAVAPTYAGSKMVTKALDQLFAGKDHGLSVHGFCR